MNVNSGLVGCQKGAMPALFLGLLMFYSSSFAQKITVLPADGAFSRENSPQGALRYQRQMYLVTAAELLASGLPTASMINSIGFILGAAQDSVTKGKFKVYHAARSLARGRGDGGLR